MKVRRSIVFAWFPVKLESGAWAWWRNVYKVEREYAHIGGCFLEVSYR